MITEADEQIIKAKNWVDLAVRAISNVVVDECAGTDDLTALYKLQLQNVLSALINVRNDLRA